MSGYPPSAPQQGKRRKGGGGREGSRGGGRVKVYLHAVTEAQAELLTKSVNACPLDEVKKKSGANIEIDQRSSIVPGMKIVIISSVPSQIEEAIRLINQKISSKGTLSEQAQAFWVQWVENSFPDLDSRAYFLPPVYVNRVPMVSQVTHDMKVLVLQSAPEQAGHSSQPATASSAAEETHIQPPFVHESDVRDDAAKQRVLSCLKAMCEENGEVLVGMSQLVFGQYLGEPCYAAAAAQLPIAASLPSSSPINFKQGEFDVLLIHRHYGFVVCEVKTFGDIVLSLNMPQQDIDNNIRKKLRDAVSQLDKAEAMLSHLVSDIAPGLRITKTIAFPNLTTRQLQQAISGDTQLTKNLCGCLGTTDPADITSLCLSSDQLSDPKTPWDVSSHVLRELGHWWQRRVAGAGPDGYHLTLDVYKSLVARFCGPATTVTVPYISPPRLSVKTLGQAVSLTGECCTALITLFPEQVHLLNTAPSRLYVAGPPGTGKTVVLLLMGIEWMRCGHHVYIVSTWWWSYVACSMLHSLLLKTVESQQSANSSSDKLHLVHYDLFDGKDVEKAISEFSQLAMDESLYIIVDEAGPDKGFYFQIFCENLLRLVPRLHLWAASCFHGHAPPDWQVEYLTRPLRSPPAVIREVQQHKDINGSVVQSYSERGVPDHTDGPPVRRLYHRGQGHSSYTADECVTCGREVANFLHSLRVGVADNIPTTSTTVAYTTPPCLQWKDVLVLYCGDFSDTSGMVKGLQEAKIPVRLINDDDIEDMVTARSDVVWMAGGHRVRGVERKVIVCIQDEDDNDVRLHAMSRCTSQLVIICSDE